MLPTTISQLDRIKAECQSLVNKRATASAAAAVVPVPGADIAADVAIMMELLPAISRRFGLSHEQIEQLDSQMKAKMLTIVKGIGSELIGKLITKKVIAKLLQKVGTRVAVKQVTKFIPFIGQAVSAGISFGAMKYLGSAHIDDCYNVCKRMIEQQNADH